jgi:hypothetical protein
MCSGLFNYLSIRRFLSKISEVTSARQQPQRKTKTRAILLMDDMNSLQTLVNNKHAEEDTVLSAVVRFQSECAHENSMQKRQDMS